MILFALKIPSRPVSDWRGQLLETRKMYMYVEWYTETSRNPIIWLFMTN